MTLLTLAGLALGRSAVLPIVNMVSICLALSIILCLVVLLLRRRAPGHEQPAFTVPGGTPMILVALACALLMVGVALLEPLINGGGKIPPEWFLLGLWAAAGIAVWLMTRHLRRLNAPQVSRLDHRWTQYRYHSDRATTRTPAQGEPVCDPGARKVIITCAVTGNAPFNPRHPAFPVNPAQIAAACTEAARAGAAVVHIHVRDPKTAAGSRDPRLFKEVVDRLRDTSTDVIINLTAGMGAFFLPDPANEGHALPESDVVGVDERTEHLALCRPELASLDITTANQVEGKLEYVYLNTTRTLRGMAKRFQELGVKPELETFTAGDVEFGKALVHEGLVTGAPLSSRARRQVGRASRLAHHHVHARAPASAGAMGGARYRSPADAGGGANHAARWQCARRP